MAETEPTDKGRSAYPAAPPAPGSHLADPAALGLAGFAMTTFFLSAVNADLLGGIGGFLPLALFYGGTVQLLAGMWEFARGNTFAAAAFSSYGGFWLSFWWLSTHTIPAAVKGGASGSEISHGVGLYLLCWLIFTTYMFIASLKTNLAVVVVFGTLVLAYLFLCIGAFQNQPSPSGTMTQVGGWCGLVCAVAAWYTAWATVTNSTFKKTVLPVGPLA